MKARLFLISGLVAVALLALIVTQSVLASGKPQWTQVNESGFGDSQTGVITSLTEFRGQLYAGTAPNVMPDRPGVAQIWRKGEGNQWTAIMTDGFGNPNNFGIDHLFVFKGKLYAGTINGVEGGEIWRSSDGSAWERVVAGGFGTQTNGEVFRLFEFKDQLYASAVSYDPAHGFELWRTTTGNPDEWTRVVDNGFGNPNNATIGMTMQFKDHLYAGAYSFGLGDEIWRTKDGVDWQRVDTGISKPTSWAVSGMVEYKGYLYISTFEAWPDPGTIGDQVFRCRICDGSDWKKVVDNGFGNSNSSNISTLIVLQKKLYFVPGNSATGLEVWRTSSGANWKQVGFGGFGNPNNQYPYFSHSSIVYNDHLYIGTFNAVDGGQVWMLEN